MFVICPWYIEPGSIRAYNPPAVTSWFLIHKTNNIKSVALNFTLYFLNLNDGSTVLTLEYNNYITVEESFQLSEELVMLMFTLGIFTADCISHLLEGRGGRGAGAIGVTVSIFCSTIFSSACSGFLVRMVGCWTTEITW